MAFLLYDVKSTDAGKHYTLVHNIPLAGSNGPLAAIHNSKNPTKKKSFPWHASDAEILQNIEGAKSEQEFVIDLKPNAKGNLSLYRLLDVWGFSYDNWTPLALRLECLFVDDYRDDSKDFKKSFPLPLAERDFVGEFLFVKVAPRVGRGTGVRLVVSTARSFGGMPLTTSQANFRKCCKREGAIFPIRLSREYQQICIAVLGSNSAGF